VKLSKPLAKRHQEALALVRSGRPLTRDERAFVLEHFHEGAEHMNGLAGAFFTPSGLARDFAVEVPECRRILDLCAGIGKLAEACDHKAPELVCVELNQHYVDVGKVVLPSATWVCASAFDVEAYRHLGPFDCVISNPPFGTVKASGFDGRYTGGLFEYRIIDLASTLAPRGVFIVPQESAPFRYSGRRDYQDDESDRARKFREQTGILMEANCGIDTAVYRTEWKGVSPVCEIVVCDFAETLKAKPAQATEQMALFGGAP
jgi:predicted RNA methylase